MNLLLIKIFLLELIL